MKNAHLPVKPGSGERRYPHSSSLRRTGMYASFHGILGALHLDIFQQPTQQEFFNNLLEKRIGRVR